MIDIPRVPPAVFVFVFVFVFVLFIDRRMHTRSIYDASTSYVQYLPLSLSIVKRVVGGRWTLDRWVIFVGGAVWTVTFIVVSKNTSRDPGVFTFTFIINTPRRAQRCGFTPPSPCGSPRLRSTLRFFLSLG